MLAPTRRYGLAAAVRDDGPRYSACFCLAAEASQFRIFLNEDLGDLGVHDPPEGMPHAVSFPQSLHHLVEGAHQAAPRDARHTHHKEKEMKAYSIARSRAMGTLVLAGCLLPLGTAIAGAQHEHHPPQHKPAKKQAAKVMYKAQCGMMYTEAEAKKYHFICPMDKKPLKKVVVKPAPAKHKG